MARRQPSSSWIHRWSRPLIAGVAGLGAVETGYLSLIHFTSGVVACPTRGCDQVLSSPYAALLGLPLTLLGCFAYLTMAGLALAPLLISSDRHSQWRARLEQWTWLSLFAGAIAMVLFSGYLLYLLAVQIQVLCLYCLVSALFTVMLLVLTLLGRAWPDLGQLFVIGTVVAVMILTGTLGAYAQGKDSPASAGMAGPELTTVSGPAEIALADHLQQIEAKMYGAYWCPHCHEQKQLFGKIAFAKITYIECDPAGKNAQPQRCDRVGITGFPTWEIDGQLHAGTLTLGELAQLSGYQGPQTFQNLPPNH